MPLINFSTALVRRIFSQFDKDGDGVITVEELHDVFEELGKQMTHEEVCALICLLTQEECVPWSVYWLGRSVCPDLFIDSGGVCALICLLTREECVPWSVYWQQAVNPMQPFSLLSIVGSLVVLNPSRCPSSTNILHISHHVEQCLVVNHSEQSIFFTGNLQSSGKS